MSYRILRRKPLLLAVLAVFGVVLASCSGTTDPATNVTQTTAKLNAHVGCDGGNTKSYNGTAGEPCSFYFRLRKVGDTAWTGTPRQPNGDPAQGVNAVASNVPASADVTNLDPATQYEYEVCGRGDATHADTCPSQSGAATTKFTTLAASDPDNQAVPTAPAGWNRVGSEDFAATAQGLPSSFTQYPSTWKDTSKQGTYGCQMGPSTSGGNLHFRLAGGLVCAPVFKTQGGTGTLANGMPAGMTEGRYSVRFRVRSGASSSHKIAWLLWPDTDVWADGEIDYPEVSSFPGEAKAFTHHPGANVATDQDAFASGVTVGSDNTWHVATVERKATSVKYLLDGNVVGTSTDRLPSKAMHWVLQSETKTSATSVPAMSEITDIDLDWVSVDKPQTTPPPPAACGDGLDNDSDGKIDLNDPGCTSLTDTSETDPIVGGSTITAGAVGDVCEDGGCGEGGRTAQTIQAFNPDIVLGLGDYQYNDDGSGGSRFNANFVPKWSGLIPKIAPVFGNTHDTEGGSGVPSGYVLNYFDQNGAPEARGKIVTGYTTGSKWGYSFDLSNGWHVVALNYTAGSGAVNGLAADLAAHPSQCLLVLDHAPIYGSPTSTHSSNEGAFFKQTLLNAGADLILTGHQHNYERVVADGLTSITDGLGGIGHYSRTGTATGSVAYNASSFGPVKVQLSPTGWDTQFVPNAGASAFSDTASGDCQ